MIQSLAGVPGKLKTLLDRLTATRAGYLDNTQYCTSARMAKLDGEMIGRNAAPPVSGDAVAGEAIGPVLSLPDSLSQCPARATGAVTSGVYATVLNITGEGFLCTVGCSLGIGLTAYLKITIDGNKVREVSAAASGSTSYLVALSRVQISYKTSLKIEFKHNSTASANVHYLYFPTA